MNVYIIHYDVAYEFGYVKGVYAKFEEALDNALRAVKEGAYLSHEDVTIEEWMVGGDQIRVYGITEEGTYKVCWQK